MSREQNQSRSDWLRSKHTSFDESFLISNNNTTNTTKRPKSTTDSVFTRAKSTLTTIGDAWKNKPSSPPPVVSNAAASSSSCVETKKVKTKKQLTLDYFLKPKKTDKTKNNTVEKLIIPPSKILVNEIQKNPHTAPAEIEICKQNGVPETPLVSIQRSRPATIASSLPSERPKGILELPETDRPRKKLSFREPEIMGYSFQKNETLPRKSEGTNKSELFRSISAVISSADSYEDLELESQAMRVVRTVGQAFEVCHKLQIEETSSPEHKKTHSENNNEDEISKCNADDSVNNDQRSDKNSTDGSVHKRDLLSEPIISEKLIDTSENTHQKSPRPERTHSSLNPPQKITVNSTSDLYNSAFIEPLKPQNVSQSESGSSPVPSHQEVQLLREQLDQQTRQTQAALAQVQMLQDQLAAERAARLEAQARTHQLLVHNRELLDHITALISHLEDTDRTTGPVVPEPASHPPGHLMCVSQQRCDPASAYLSTQPESPLRKTMSRNVLNFNPYQDYSLPMQHYTKQYLDLYNNPNFLYPSNLTSSMYPSYIYQNKQIDAENILQTPPATKKSYPSSPTAQKFRRSLNDVGTSDMSQFPDLSTIPFGKLDKDNIKSDSEQNKNIIKPLSQVSTLTTTDEEGRVRVIVPVSPEEDDKVQESLVTLRITDEDGTRRVINGPPCITRSTSEKLPNRSELMSQVQRTMWARHTTK